MNPENIPTASSAYWITVAAFTFIGATWCSKDPPFLINNYYAACRLLFFTPTEFKTLI